MEKVTENILDADRMTDWELCPRKWKWGAQWELERVTPIQAVRLAIQSMLTCLPGNPVNPMRENWGVWCQQRVMEILSQRGVDTPYRDPYALAAHHAAMAEVVGRILRGPSDPPVKPFGVVYTGGEAGKGGVPWNVLSMERGERLRLERVILTDRWDDDRQLRELHSWRTLGDVCVTGLPMALKIIVLGPQRNGYRCGPWTQARQHPRNKGLRWARRHGREEGFSGSWDKVWREQAKVDAQHWLEGMERDGVLREAVIERQVRVPKQVHVTRVLEDIRAASAAMSYMKVAEKPLPMVRSACDFPVPCQYQQCCYSELELGPGELPVFRERVTSGK